MDATFQAVIETNGQENVAMSTFMARFGECVRGAVRDVLVNRWDQDDAASETYVRILANNCRLLRKYREDVGSADAYLKGIARNVARKLIERRTYTNSDEVDEVDITLYVDPNGDIEPMSLEFGQIYTSVWGEIDGHSEDSDWLTL